MGMPVGANKNGTVSDPNIVPLIDVLLVLIIIFMVITPQISMGLRAVLPQAATEQTPSDPNTIVVQVTSGGKLLINEEPVDWDKLGSRLATIFKRRATKIAFVRGSDDVPFDQVARAVDIMREVGLDHIGLMTR